MIGRPRVYGRVLGHPGDSERHTRMETIFQLVPNGGIAVALIVMTHMFLKKQEKDDEKIHAVIKMLTEIYTREITLGRKDYIESVKEIIVMHQPKKGTH